MSRFFWVVRKDLAVFFADKSGAVMVIVVPLLLGVMMGLIFHTGDGTSTMDVGVVNEDGGPTIVALIQRLDAEQSLKVQVLERTVARDKVAAGKLGVVLVFGANVGKQLTATAMFGGAETGAKRNNVVPMWVDPSRAIEANIVKGLLTKAMMETMFSQVSDPKQLGQMFTDLLATTAGLGDSQPELKRFIAQGVAFATESQLAAEKSSATGTDAKPGDGFSLAPPLDVVREEIVAAGPTAGFNSHAHTFAGMLMQFLLFMAISSAKGLFAERGVGTLDRLRMTATSPASILLGAAGAVAVICLLSTAVIFGVGALFFGVEFRSGILAFGLVSVAQAVFIGSFMLLMAGLANSDKQLDGVGTMLVLALCFVSGAWVPAFMLPDFIAAAGPAVPTRWILDGFAGATWRGLGLGHALQSAGGLLAFSVVFSAIGLNRFRWA